MSPHWEKSLPRRSVLRLSALGLALMTWAAHGQFPSLGLEPSEMPTKGPPYMSDKKLVWRRLPLDTTITTARFGQDFGRGPHRGHDYGGVPAGTPVFAPADGTVVPFTNSWNEEYQDYSFGRGVCLDHEGTPWYSLYAHLSQVIVAIGDKVKAGQMIGRVGWSGVVLPKGPGGTHLHWQVCRTTSFPTDISYSADPLSFPVIPEEEIDMSKDEVEAMIKRILDERKMETNFADSVTNRIGAIHEATKKGTPEEMLAGIHRATDLNNRALVA